MRAAFVIYCLVMLWLLFGQRLGRISWLSGGAGVERYLEQLRWNWNLVPFRTVRAYAATLAGAGNPHLVGFAFVNLAGNVVMFVPLGVFLPFFWPKLRQFRRFLLAAALTVAAVEVTQLFTLLGSADIDDLILNLVGGAIGFAIYKGSELLYRRFEKRA